MAIAWNLLNVRSLTSLPTNVPFSYRPAVRERLEPIHVMAADLAFRARLFRHGNLVAEDRHLSSPLARLRACEAI